MNQKLQTKWVVETNNYGSDISGRFYWVKRYQFSVVMTDWKGQVEIQAAYLFPPGLWLSHKLGFLLQPHWKPLGWSHTLTMALKQTNFLSKLISLQCKTKNANASLLQTLINSNPHKRCPAFWLKKNTNYIMLKLLTWLLLIIKQAKMTKHCQVPLATKLTYCSKCT